MDIGPLYSRGGVCFSVFKIYSMYPHFEIFTGSAFCYDENSLTITCIYADLRWVVGSILHGEPIELFLVPARAPRRLCNKGCDMCYPVCGMMHIKRTLAVNRKE